MSKPFKPPVIGDVQLPGPGRIFSAVARPVITHAQPVMAVVAALLARDKLDEMTIWPARDGSVIALKAHEPGQGLKEIGRVASGDFWKLTSALQGADREDALTLANRIVAVARSGSAPAAPEAAI